MPEILEIKALGPQGDGIAYHEGAPVYIARAAIGDIVNAELIPLRGGGYTATIIDILTHGLRQHAPCPHYDDCGGCQMQHLDEANYRVWKDESIRTVLTKAGVVPKIWGEPVFLPHATRRRVAFGARKEGAKILMGLHRAGTNELSAIEACLLLTETLNKMLQSLPAWLNRFIKEGTNYDIFLQEIDGAAEMVISGPLTKNGEADSYQRKIIADMCDDLGIVRVSWRKTEFGAIEPLISLETPIKHFSSLAVEIPPAAFLQPSSQGEAVLVSLVQQAMPKKSRLAIVDLFCGCGTFSGAGLDFGSVHAVEDNPSAVTAVQKASRYVQKLSVEKRDLIKEPLSVRELKAYEVAIVDPPRAGAKEQFEKLAKSAVHCVISISCNPVTFARDAAILTGGGFAFQKLTMVDQFIWSHHTEVVGVFRRKA